MSSPLDGNGVAALGDIVETVKGAKFWGRIVAIDVDDNSPGCTVLAIDPAFAGTKHVYPLKQLQRRAPAPSQTAVEPVGDEDRMLKISKVIEDLTGIKERFGDTCVYIRRGGMSWGAVALNRQADDKERGVFDLQAQHDRDILARDRKNLRLIEDNDELRERVHVAESALTAQAAALVAAERQSEALMAKLQPLLAAHGTCGCSYDTPDDLCMHHSPQLVAATARAEAAEKRIAELEAGLAFYASKANYADVPLQQWFRENEGKDAPTGYRCGNIDISAKPGHAIAPIFADLGDLARRLTHQEKNNGR